MECDVCKENKVIYKCDGCPESICKNCGKLTASEVKVLELNSRVLKFYCQKCKQAEPIMLLKQLIESKNEIIAKSETIITDKEEIINLLKKELQQMKADKL